MPVNYSADFEKATRVLHATERAVPYNNFANLYVQKGQVPNPRFGGDCMYQAHVFAERFRAAVNGVPVRFHNEEGEGTRGHIVPITGDGDERLVFEITQLATEPVSLAAIRGRANAKRILAFPVPPEGDRELSLFWLPHLEQLNMSMLSNCNGGLLHHRIATDPSIALPETWHPTDAYMCAQPRRPMRMHLLEADSGKSTLTMDPVDGAMTAQRVGAPAVHSGAKAFDGEIARIARSLGVTRMQLLEFFEEGRLMECALQGMD